MTYGEVSIEGYGAKSELMLPVYGTLTYSFCMET